MTTSAISPYEQLAELFEHQLQLAGQGRYDELSLASAACSDFIAQLPASPPPSAGPALERARLIHQRLEIELQRCREGLVLASAAVASGRRALDGYAPARRRRRISATA